MNIFLTLTAGDSSDWFDLPHKHHQRAAPLTSADWTLTYQLRGPSQLTLTGAPEGDGWRTRIEPGQSAGLAPGEYAMVAQLTRPDDRLTIGRGRVTILADPAAITDAIDARSVAEKALTDCEAALASFKSSNGKVKSYTIGTRTTEFHSLAELMALRDFWQRKVNNERAKATGRRNPRALLVRF
jgi:hypothetical protein